VNPVEATMRRVDHWQQRHRLPAFVFAVVKKFGDDQGGNLAALIAYYAFFSIFPLLLVLVTLLGLVLRGNPALQQRVLHSALAEFPILGTQLQQNVHSLNRTGLGLVIGLIGAFLGARGVASAAQNALNTVWQVPYVRRPGFPWNQLRNVGVLVAIGLGVTVTGALSGVGGAGGSYGGLLRAGALLLSTLINIGMFIAAFRLTVAREVRLRMLLPGAIAAALVWQVLLGVGSYIVGHQLRGANQVYGFFGIVLGLLSWMYLQAQITLYLVEADVVRAKRLWPRSLLQPPLTEGDERAYTGYVDRETRRPEQDVDVGYRDSAEPAESESAEPAESESAEPAESESAESERAERAERAGSAERPPARSG